MAHVELILIGFGIVIGVLALLWAATVVVAAGVAAGTSNGQSTKPEPAARAPAAAIEARSANPADGRIPAHHLAVIASAVAATFDAPHRMVNVSGPRAHVSAWTQQGLFEHFASHRVPWRNAPSQGLHGPRIKS